MGSGQVPGRSRADLLARHVGVAPSISLDYDNVRRMFLVNFGKNMPLISQIFGQRRAKIVLTNSNLWTHIRGHHPSGASWGLSRHATFVRTKIRHASGIAFGSNFTIST